MSRDPKRRDLAPFTPDGHPTPFRFLEEGERFEYFERDAETGEMRGPYLFVVPPTLRLDDAGRAAAKKHMRECIDIRPASSQRPRPMRWDSRES